MMLNEEISFATTFLNMRVWQAAIVYGPSCQNLVQLIAYEDFIPQQISGPGFFSSAQYESFNEALKAANSFMVGREQKVLNVETVVLPNVWDEEGTTDVSIDTSGKTYSTWHQFIRVWYTR